MHPWELWTDREEVTCGTRSAAPISHAQTRGLPQVCGRPRRLSPGCPGSSSPFYPSSCQSCRWDQSVWEIRRAAFLASALVVAVESGWKDKNGREILWRWSTCLLVFNKVKHMCPKDWHDLFWTGHANPLGIIPHHQQIECDLATGSPNMLCTVFSHSIVNILPYSFTLHHLIWLQSISKTQHYLHIQASVTTTLLCVSNLPVYKYDGKNLCQIIQPSSTPLKNSTSILHKLWNQSVLSITWMYDRHMFLFDVTFVHFNLPIQCTYFTVCETVTETNAGRTDPKERRRSSDCDGNTVSVHLLTR